MTVPQRILVVGGGLTGSVLSIALAQRGVDVELVEIAPEWRGVGHGITVQGNALAAFRSVGVLDEILERSFPFDHMRLLNADGSLIARLPTPHTGGEDLPSTAGSLRSTLQAVLCDAVRAAGVNVRLGATVERYTERGDAVAVVLSDGTEATFDVMVGADGIHSRVRALMGIPERPAPSGMAIWRFVGPRPEGMQCADVYFGGPHYKAGYSPISPDQCYAYMLDEDKDILVGDHRHASAVLFERSEGYEGFWGEVRATLGPGTLIDFRRIESLLVPDPWYRGRVIIVGDAAHACPPLIAQGAAMCAEDAIVLAELLAGADDVEAAFRAFMVRRLPRVQMVVDNSLQLVEWEMDPTVPGADSGILMDTTLTALLAPA